ncbi:MAG: c-type cytochrome [Paracoccus sp. (in: a-proteobacteria)]|uniref:c-type cytochrome n=1 Tax=Paracoccus sp. TaxID=267 RepID=UPI0032429548
MNRWRIIAATLAAVGVTGALAGSAVVLLGLYNTSAQNGHWAITNWVLHTTFENAVELRAPSATAVPQDLADPALIELGARHYDSACRMCHARPGAEADATIASMVPRPPHIAEAVADWRPEEMHWIVHEGVKMSGMPAWPAPSRPDEVWAVVAFLTAIDRGLTAPDYLAMTDPAPEGYCAGCHGAQGTSRAPRLDIFDPEYIQMTLHAYRTGQRASGIMAHAITQIEPSQDERLAAALASLPGVTPQDAGGGDREAASMLAQNGTQDVPACLSCHGANNRNPLIPSLDGQGREYLKQQLVLWRAGKRGGGERAALMHSAAEHLTDQQIAQIATYFAARSPRSR